MKKIIEELFNLNRVLVSKDANKTIDILSKQIPLKKITISTGTKCFTWKIPDNWEVESAVLTDLKSNKIIADYRVNPMHLFIGSTSFKGELSFKELENHLRYKTYFGKNKDAIPYVYKYYDLDWGFSLSQNQFDKLDKTAKYKVAIKTKYSKGVLTIGEVVLKGKSKKEIIIIAHTDHPFQANDNLSSVAVALELAKKFKNQKLNHTIKILFLPETIGSIAYAWIRKKELGNIKAVLALDILGNENRVLIQKSFNEKFSINYLTEWIMKSEKVKYEMAGYREQIGSDELIFSDPAFNIPAVMLSTWPYPEYHTHFDDPTIISEEMLEKSLKICERWIKIIDRDFTPKRLWLGPLMRSKIGWFMGKQPEDRQLELIGYLIDGKKTVIELAEHLDMDIEFALSFVESLEEKKLVIRV